MEIEEKIDHFCEFLEKSKDDRKVMADLRRGLSPGTAHYAWQYLARPPYNFLNNKREHIVFQTLAAAFALHQNNHTSMNVGHVCRALAFGQGKGEEALKSFDGRFRRLLSSDMVDAICERVPSIVKAAAQRNIGIDFRQLGRDLWYWSNSSPVKTRWASAYWGGEE
ncbi:MAG: type I-E CRISPR-associated protein Cse2/CasB [Candidatus Wallbacteria bacterium]|nr:type I-E CRISPR-associated protein Cse2/CasB [Candidatus Wallbacteria bacterium]